MTEEKAKKILGEDTNYKCLDKKGIFNSYNYISYIEDDDDICLDGDFTIEQLEAIIFLMKLYKQK